MGGQVIQLFIGQCGVQVGNACWELFCAENDLDISGSINHPEHDRPSLELETLFSQANTGRFVPRSIFIDTEPTVIDEVRAGAYRNLFNPNQLISGYEDSASNYARGYYKNAKLLGNSTKNTLRHLAEECDNLLAFLVYRSNGGGTGGGFTSALFQELQDEYSKSIRMDLSLFPSDTLKTSTSEAYNALLSCHAPIESVDCALLMNNKSLLNICAEKLEVYKPTMTNLNRIIAQTSSGILGPLQFGTQLSANIPSLLTNLVPYPAAHFVQASLSPLRSPDRAEKAVFSCTNITAQVFDQSNQFLACPLEHKPIFLSCCLLYRGFTTARQVNTAIARVKTIGNIPWVDWCPTGFKIGISDQPMTCIQGSHIGQSPLSLLLLHNSTSMLPALGQVINEFQVLYSRRAFVHWYTSEGMDEAEFSDAVTTLSTLRDEYFKFHENLPDMADGKKREIVQPKSPSKHSIKEKSAASPSMQYSGKEKPAVSPLSRSTTDGSRDKPKEVLLHRSVTLDPTPSALENVPSPYQVENNESENPVFSDSIIPQRSSQLSQKERSFGSPVEDQQMGNAYLSCSDAVDIPTNINSNKFVSDTMTCSVNVKNPNHRRHKHFHHTHCNKHRHSQQSHNEYYTDQYSKMQVTFDRTKRCRKFQPNMPSNTTVLQSVSGDTKHLMIRDVGEDPKMQSFCMKFATSPEGTKQTHTFSSTHRFRNDIVLPASATNSVSSTRPPTTTESSSEENRPTYTMTLTISDDSGQIDQDDSCSSAPTMCVDTRPIA